MGASTIEQVNSTHRPPRGSYRFISEAEVDTTWESVTLPPISTDGGNEDEFKLYWDANLRPQRLAGGWFERVCHPQVNAERYWYRSRQGELVWEQPVPYLSLAESQASHEEALEPGGDGTLTGSGPAWDLTVAELKAVLYSKRAEDYGLRAEELARRACAEYEAFLPKVLSWHDYQYITFWFFGGMYKQDKGRDDAKSFFGADSGAGRELFADDSFFRAAETLIQKRIHLMHPINLTYFLWTYARAGVRAPELMKVAADHLCDAGLIPTLDRCSVGTMLWNLYKQEVRHDRYFEESAIELARPNRLRSLAPRNYQNSMIAYSRCRHWNALAIDALARGLPRLLDAHDPAFPKHDRSVLFSYTCRDGSEVPADCFRIGGLSVVAKAFHDAGAQGLPHVERCLISMLNYASRSAVRSPPMMREPGDFCGLVRQLAYAAEPALPLLARLLKGLDLEQVAHGALEVSVKQMQQALRRVG